MTVVRSFTAEAYLLPSEKSTNNPVHYPGQAYSDTHPGHLAALAALFGLTAPRVESCRVLDIGCNDGSNLIPMALGLPGGQFTGIDLAAQPVEEGSAVIARLGLKNVRLLQMDLMDVTPEFGEFDYIIAHGFYAWVPASVQQKLLAVCQANLSPNGVAFVSYTAHPGGHVRQALRDMMLFHTRGSEEPVERARQGKAFLQFLSDSVDQKSAWKTLLSEQASLLIQKHDVITSQDEFSPFYAPIHFADFAAEAGRYGLQFLSEAKFQDLADPPLEAEALRTVKEWSGSDPIRYQQYLDFLTFRGFRRTLLCRSEHRLEREGLEQRLGGLWMASLMRKTTTSASGAVRFVTEGATGAIETGNSVVIEALQRLEERWPHGEAFPELVKHVESRLASSIGHDVKAILAEVFLALAVSGLAEFRTYRPLLAQKINRYPVASPLVRWQASGSGLLTNLLQVHIEMKDPPARTLLQLLDGTRNRQDLAAALLAGHPTTPHANLDAMVSEALKGFHRMALLIA